MFFIYVFILTYYTKRQNKIQPIFCATFDDARGSGGGEIESHERLINCMHAVDNIFGIKANNEIFTFKTNCDLLINVAVFGMSI